MQAAILTDTSKCIGCRQCVIACKRVNKLAPDVPHRWSRDDGLSARNWTAIVDRPDGTFVRKQCRHCLEPTCASVCPVGALQKTDIGPVIYDGNKCMGCRYCMMACPYGIPRYDWDQTRPYVRKCILCYDRVKAGGKPACTEACPTGATIFGERSQLLEIAHQRIDKEPDKYIKKVWGEHEVGGTSILYISQTDLSFLTQGKPLEDEPIPERTKLAMNAVPFAFLGMASCMAGINWMIGRRMKLEREPESADHGSKEHEDA